MTMMRNNALDLLDPAIRYIMWKKLKDWKPLYTRTFNEEKSVRNQEKESAMAGLGIAALKQEGRGIQFDDPIQGYDKTYTHDSWALGFRVTMEMWMDDLHATIKKMPAGLSRSAIQRVEVQCANIFNRAFNGSYTGPDGVTLSATNHPILSGGTQSNRSATDAALSVTSLQAALTAFRKFTDDRGIPVLPTPKHLIIPPDKEWIAKEILKSEKKPYTADNETNVVKGEVDYIINPYLTSAYYWYVLSDKDEHELKFFWRMRPDVESDTDFFTRDLLWSMVMRFSVGWTHYCGFWGSAASA